MFRRVLGQTETYIGFAQPDMGSTEDEFDPRRWSLENLPKDGTQRFKVLRRYPLSEMSQKHCKLELDYRDPVVYDSDPKGTQTYKWNEWIMEEGEEAKTGRHRKRRPTSTSNADVHEWRAWLRKARFDANWAEPTQRPEENLKTKHRLSFSQGEGEENAEEEEPALDGESEDKQRRWNTTMDMVMMWALANPGSNSS